MKTMRKGGFEIVTLTGCNKDKRQKGKHRVTYLKSLHEWMTDQGEKSFKKCQEVANKILFILFSCV